MAKVTVHHDRLSRYSALLMILLGVVTWFFYGFPGVVIIAVGLAMYWFYRRQTRVARASGKAGTAKGATF
jgi:energy-converting hydrogenase Eha subunit G